MDTEQKAALDADKRVTQSFKDWQAEKDPENRKWLKHTYENEKAYAIALWKRVGPDPILSQLKRAQEVQDELEGHND